jgi:hypothetical protein
LSHETKATALASPPRKPIAFSTFIPALLADIPNGLKLIEQLFFNPLITINEIRRLTGISHATAGRLVKQMMQLDIF